MKNKAFPTSGKVKWGYGLNHWKTSFQGFARKEQHLRAFKVNAACGFRAVEMVAGSGPWEPLGRPEAIAHYYGSARDFFKVMNDCGIERIISVVYDPAAMSFEEGHFGLAPTNPDDHDALLHRCTIHADFLAEVGGELLIVYPVPAFWKCGALDDGQIRSAADCWNAVGAMAAERGLRLAFHIDALSALRTADEIAHLLELCDVATVGLAIDTAELTIARHDVVALYRRFAPRVWHFQFKDALAVDELDEYRLPHADRAMMLAGGAREVPRWFGELGSGRVDFAALMQAIKERGFEGWIIVESDKGPEPVAGTMMSNSWYVQNVLLGGEARA
ncbi:MAG TPA: TIM barrel protein [Novosphingobium sp.]|nr:TIM barrel protein [Novosphingobium sp.]